MVSCEKVVRSHHLALAMQQTQVSRLIKQLQTCQFWVVGLVEEFG
jgi:hypothetical protein